MNAQLNSTNFQQFVATNKGKSIMFKHTDEKNVSTDVIRYVVDVCADYFTFKNNESDAKIGGFYYYTDCKMVEEKHPLISVLEKHRFVLIKSNFWGDRMIEYIDNDGVRINGKSLVPNYPNSSVSMTIKNTTEVWATLYDKFSKVWEEKPVATCTQGTTESKAQKVKKQLDPEDGKIKEFLSTHRRGMTVYTEGIVYRDFDYIGVMTAEESTLFSRIIVMGNCDDFQINIPLSDIYLVVRGQDSYERGWKRFFEKESDKKETEKKEPGYKAGKNEVKFNVFKENVVEWEALVSKYYFFVGYTPDRSEYLEFQNILNRVKTEGFSEELYKELVRCSDLLRERIVSRMRCGYNDFILKMSRKYAELINKIKKAVGEEPVDDLIEKIKEKLDTTKDAKKTLQIEYRGKAKTVEVMNEYTHKNGKDYVLVRDMTDNGKTKTLFKEYIKYM